MNKFLRLIEQNRPGADTYTVELKDAGGLLDSFEMWGTGSPPEAFDAFRADLANRIKSDEKLSKFLTLVDEYTPSEDKYTVELKDFKGESVPNYFFEVQGADDFKEFMHGQFDEFKEDWGAPFPVEDAEIKMGPEKYDVEKAVTGLADTASSGLKGLAARAVGTGAQQAKSAVKKRDKLAKKAINLYQKKTKELGKAIQAAGRV